MSDQRITASAIVTLTIEIESYSSWGPECSVDQIHSQAAKEVTSQVKKALKEGRCGVTRLIGEPLVRSVIARETK